MKHGFARIRHAGLAALVAGAALTGLSAKPAHAATACGAVITNLSWVTWTSVWGVTITGAQYTQTSSTAFVNVVGVSFVAMKDWFNVTTGSKANPLPGHEIRFTITVTNIGTDTITTLHITDTLATGLAYKAGSLGTLPAGGWATSVVGQVVRADQAGSQINIGSTALIVFSAMVSEVCTPTAIGNTAYLDGFGICTGMGYYNATPFIATPAVTSLRIDKTQNPAAPAIGSPVVYRMVVTNIGTATVDSLILTDTISPSIISATSWGPVGLPAAVITGVASGTRYVWSAGPGLAMAPGVAYTFTISGTVGVVCNTTIVSNTAFVSALNACAPASATSMISPTTLFTLAANSVSMKIEKQQIQTTPQIGNPITYRIILTNIGSDTVTSLTLTDTLPAAIVSASAWGPSGFATPLLSGTTYSFNASGPTLMVPNQIFTFTITGNIGLVCQNTVVSNTAYVLAVGACSSTALSASSPSYVVLAPVTTIAVTKQQTAPVTTPGAPVTYRIIVANTGSATITGVTVIDTVSSYVVSATAFGPSGFPTPTVVSVAGSGTVFTWSSAAWTVNPGVNFTFTISGFVAPECVPYAVSNTAYVAATAACTTTAFLSNAVGFVIQGAPLGVSVVKRQVGYPGVGSPWLYQIVVTNTGADTVTSLTVTDTVPPTFVVTGYDAPVVMGAPVITPLGPPSGTRYAWSSAAAGLAPAQSFTFTISGNVGMVCIPTALSNTAYIVASACSSTALFASAPGAVVQPPLTNLFVRKIQTPAIPGPGNQVTYAIVVTNIGQMTITSVNVVDTISAAITLSATSAGTPTGFPAPTVIGGGSATRFEWLNVAPVALNPGQSFTFTISGNVGTVCVQTLVSNTAWISGSGACAISTTVLTTNQTDFILPAPVLSFNVTKQLIGGVAIGDPVTYRIVVFNTGAATIENLRILDTISGVIMNQASTVNDKPAAFALPTVTSVGTGTQYVWSANVPAGLLNPGQSFTFTITGNIGPVCAPTTLTNTVFADGGIACSQQNVVGWSGNTVIAPATTVLGIVKTLTKTPLGIGDAVEYRIVVTNLGTATLTSAAIVDTLPSQFVVSGSAQNAVFGLPVAVSPAVGSTRFTWSTVASPAGNLLPGMAYTVTITGNAGYVCANIAVSNTAFANASSICQTVSVNSSVVGYTYGTPSLGIDVTKQLIGGTGVGAPLGYLISVLNTGGATLTDLIVVDTVSAVLVNGAGTVPAGFTLTITDQPGSGTRFVWNNTVPGSMNFTPGAVMTFTITGQAGLVCAPTLITNTAYANGSFFCGNIGDFGASANVTIQPPVTGLTVSKLMPQFPLSAGGVVRYQIVVVNSGTATLTSVRITDTVHVTIMSQATDRDTLFFNAPTIVNLPAGGGTWYEWTNSQPINPGSIFTFTITGVAGEVCVQTLVSNTAWISGSSACSTTTMRTNGVHYVYGTPSLGIDVVKTVGGSAGVGAPISYIIYVTNTGGATLTSLVVTDTLSPVVMNAVVDMPPTGGWTQAVTSVAGSGTRYDWTAGGGFNFFPTQVLTFTITGQIGMVCATTTISNSAFANGAFTCGGIAAVKAAGNVVVQPPLFSLGVRKNQIPALPGTGSLVTYQIVVTNIGAATANSITVVDTISAVVTLSPTSYDASKAPAAFGAATVTDLGGTSGTRFEWTASNAAGLLNPGQSFTFTITGNVGLVCAQADVSNTAWIFGSGTCTSTVLTTNNTFFQVPAPVLNIAVTKQQTGGLGVGSPVSYLIIVENVGGATITNITVTDTVASQVMNVIFDAGSLPAPTITSVASGTRYAWSGTLATPLNPASVFTVTISGNIGLVCVPTTISNTAFVTAFNACAVDIQQSNAVGARVLPPVTGLSIVKTQTPANPGVGAAVQYDIVVTNTGSATLTSVIVTDTIAPQITGATGNTPAGFNAPVMVGGASATRFEWTNSGAFTPGTAVTFTINGIVGLVCAQADITNTAFVIGMAACSTTSMISNVTGFTVPAPLLDISVVKTRTGGAGVGSPVTYDITVNNIGGATITDLIVTDTLANEITNVVTTLPATFGEVITSQPAAGGTRYVWSATGLSFFPGTSLVFTVNANIGVVCAPTTVSNTAFVTAFNTCAVDTQQSNAVGSLIAPHTAVLTVVKSIAPASPGTGAPVTYSIVVTNAGTATLVGVSVTDTISAVITAGVGNTPAGFNAPVVIGGASATQFSWTNSLPFDPGTSRTFTIDGTVGLVCVNTDVTNTAYATAVRDDCQNRLTASGASGNFNLPAPALTISVVKTRTGGSGVGSPVTYDITVNNTGGATITDLIVTDTLANAITNVVTTLPATFGEVITSQPAAGGTRYVWSATGLSFFPGTSLVFTVNANIGVVCAPTTVSNTALVEAKNTCANTFVQSNAVGSLIAPHTEGLSIVKTVVGGAAVAAPVTYTLTVQNTGTATLSNVLVTDTMSPVVMIAVQGTAGGFATLPVVQMPSGTLYGWSLATFAPGASAALTLDGTIGAVCVTTDVGNTAFISGRADCAGTLTDRDSAPVLSFAGLALTISVVKTQTGGAGIGAPVTYTIDVTNTGSATISDLTVVDTVAGEVVNVTTPAVAGFAITATDAPAASGTRYQWTGTGLTFSPGATLTFTVNANIGVVCASTRISNTALVEAANFCANTFVQSNVVGALVAPHLDAITVVKTQTGGAGSGAPVTYTIDVTNTGTSTISALRVIDSVSESFVNAVSTEPGGWVPPVVAAIGTGATRYVWSNTGLAFQPGQALQFTLAGNIGVVCAITQVSNTAMATATMPCGLVSDVAVPVGSLIAPHIDGLTVVKSVVGGAGVGSAVTYTIDVTNTGTSTLNGVVVTDTISAVVTGGVGNTPAGFNAPVVIGGASSTQFSWSAIGGFNPGLTRSFTIDGTIGLVCVATDVSNTAYARGVSNCAVLETSSSSGVLAFSAPALTISVVKTLTGGAGIGAPVTYDITVNNTGGATITDLIVTDTLANEIVNVATTLPGGFGQAVTSVASGTRYVWTGAGLSFFPGTSLVFTVNANVGIVCAPTQISNTALVEARTACAGIYQQSNAVGALVAPHVNGITVVKAQSLPNGAGIGEPVSYTIDVTNTGTSTITSLTVVDSVSESVMNLVPGQPALWAAPVITAVGTGATRYVWSNTGLTFQPGQTLQFTLAGNLGLVCAVTQMSNTAMATATTPCALVSDVAVPVGALVAPHTESLTIVKSVVGGAAVAAPVTYTITVQNTGTATLRNVVIRDTVSAFVMIGSQTTAGGFAAMPVVAMPSGTLYGWSLASFAPGASAALTLDGVIGQVCVATDVGNTAFIAADSDCSGVLTGASSSAVLSFTAPVLSVQIVKTQTFPSGAPGIGEPVTYTIDVTNTGAATITTLTISDTIAAELFVTSTTQPGGWVAPVATSVAATGTRYVWSNNTLTFSPGATLQFTVNANIGLVCAPATVDNYALALAENQCAITSDQDGPTTFGITPPTTSYTVVKIQTPAAPAGTGAAVTYAVVVTNSGSATLSNVVVSDTISALITGVTTNRPVGFPVESVTSVASGTRYAWSGTTATGLFPGQSWTFTMTGLVGVVCSPVSVSNTAYVNATSACAAPGGQFTNVTGFDLTAPSVSIALVKTQVTPAVASLATTGAPVQYTIAVTNTGAATISTLTVTDTLSPVLTQVAATVPGGFVQTIVSVAGSGTRYSWTNGALTFSPGATLNFTINAVAGEVCALTNVSNTAFADAGTLCGAATASDGGDDFSVGPFAVGITLVKTQNAPLPLNTSVGAGTVVQYTLVVTNTGSATLNTVTIVDTLQHEIVVGSTTQPGLPAPVVAAAGPSASRFVWSGTGLTFLPGQSFTITINAVSGVAAAVVHVSNTGYVDGRNACGLSATMISGPVDFFITPAPTVLTLTKQLFRITNLATFPAAGSFAAVANGTVLPLQTSIFYRIVASNTGGTTINNLEIFDTVQPQFAVATTQQPTGWLAPTIAAAGPSGTTFQWLNAAAALNIQERMTFTITGQIGFVCAASNIPNAAWAEGVSASGGSVTVSNSVDFNTLAQIPNLTIAKRVYQGASDITGGAGAGGMPTRYRIVVTNTGNASIYALTITDLVPAMITVVSTDQPASMGAPAIGGGGERIWTYALPTQPIMPGESITVTVYGNSDSCFNGVIVNSATATGTDACATALTRLGTAAYNNTSPLTTVASFSKRVFQGGVDLTNSVGNTGVPTKYIITLANNGTDTLTNISLIDILPPVQQFTLSPVGALAYDGAVLPAPTISGTMISFAAGASLAPGRSTSVTIYGWTGDCFTGTIVNNSSADGVWTCPTAPLFASTSAPTLTVASPAPLLTTWKDWFSDPTWSIKTPVPQMGSKVYWKLVVANTGGKPANLVEIIDSVPAAWVNLDTSRYALGYTVIAPAGKTVTITSVPNAISGDTVMTATITGATNSTLEPGESVTIYIDGEVRQWAAGTAVVDNVAHATGLNPCSGAAISSAAVAPTFIVAPGVTLNIKIYNASGEVVRTYPIYQVGTVASAIDLSYSVTGSAYPACALVGQGSPASAPFSPDGDCLNDLIAFIFPDLGGFGVSWDGKNDLGQFVVNGTYQVVAEFVDPQSGSPVTLDAFITLSAKRTEVLATIYNAAGEAVALIDTSRVPRAVASVTLEPSVFAPIVNPAGPNDALRIHLFDAEGVEIDADGDASNGLTPLLWYGRTCPNDPDKVCDTPNSGQIVNNGAYLIQLISADVNGDVTTVTVGITVNHGEILLISNVLPAPNPVPAGANEVWVTYQVPSASLAGLSVKIYNVAGELVRNINTYDMMGVGQDPFGTMAGVNCPTANCGVFKWDLLNQSGQRAANGLYVIVIDATDVGGTLQRTLTKLAIQ